ncbi:MAG TPA: AsnC family transcriptional regulator [Thermoplasmata archaeon]|nr:AsnC family transcriptional regulator [Thermoplasmata archaeon]
MWTPDDLDIRIIKALASPSSFQWDARISYAHVAAELDVDEETVRNRVRRMNDVRFLRGWQLVLNPALLGREAAIVELRIDDSESKPEVISRLKLIEGVMLIDDFYGKELAVLTLCENSSSLERQVRLFASLCGGATPVWWKLGFPPCELIPTRTDWRIMQALRKDGRGRLSDVARGLGLSTRTVKRRVTQLVDGNAFYLDPILDLGNVGGVRCRFWVTTEASWKQAVDKTILSGLPRIVSTHTAPQEYSLFVAHLSNLPEVQGRVLWMKQLAGVRDVRSTIEVEHIHVEEWVRGEIEKRLSTLAT